MTATFAGIGKRGKDVAGESPADRLLRACRASAIAALKDSRMDLSCSREPGDARAGWAASASGARGRSVQSMRSMLSNRSLGA
ncbi:hypothetical protein COCOBI_12-0830 [Coccomyxa sp. Obi]|nr:hypothetical protein COCOBI_12-0830 [Coccomyxa sp. Obi]